MLKKTFRLLYIIAFVSLLCLNCFRWMKGLNITLSNAQIASVPAVSQDGNNSNDIISDHLPSFLENTEAIRVEQNLTPENPHPLSPNIIPDEYKEQALQADLDINNIDVTSDEKDYLKDTLIKKADNSELPTHEDTQESIVIGTLDEFKSI